MGTAITDTGLTSNKIAPATLKLDMLHMSPSEVPNEPHFTHLETIALEELQFLDALAQDGDEDPML